MVIEMEKTWFAELKEFAPITLLVSAIMSIMFGIVLNASLLGVGVIFTIAVGVGVLLISIAHIA